MNTEPNKQTLFLWGMVLSMFCWGLSWTSGKVLSGYGEIASLALFRFVLTFVALFILLLFTGEKLQVQRSGLLTLLGASVCMALYNFFFFKGLFFGKAGAGGVLVTTLNPIISYAIVLFFTPRKPSRKEALGLLIGLVAGMILLKVWDDWLSIFNSGNVYFILATLTWAVLSLFTAKSSQYGSPIAFSLWIYGIGSILMGLFSSMTGNIMLYEHSDSIFWINMVFSAVVTTAFATTFFFVATARLGASKASSFIFLVPFSAALGSWTFLGEIPHWHTVSGGLLGIAAVYLLNKK